MRDFLQEEVFIKAAKLAAICTVCTKPFLKEVLQMNTLLEEIGPVKRELSRKPEESIVP